MSSSEETGKLEEVVVNSASKTEQHGTTCSGNTNNSGTGISSSSEYHGTTCSGNTNSGTGTGIPSSLEYKRAGSVLEAVPEEMGTVTIPGEMEVECASDPAGPGATDLGTCPGATAHMGTTSAQGAAAANTTTQFHIPESNASDVAPSECSSYHRHGKFLKTFYLTKKMLLMMQ